MRDRHQYLSKLILDNKIISAKDFFIRFKDIFEIHGNEIRMENAVPPQEKCTVRIVSDIYEDEEYTIFSDIGNEYAQVSPIVLCQINCANTYFDIFKETITDGDIFI